jgi:GDP-4-dehydro-6-deoxy-D-mannose reductase
VTGTVRLLSEVRARRRAGTLDPVILIVGSGEQYGRHEPAELPLRETAEQRPLTVYAASKAAQEVAALQACRSDGARVAATRSFNHSGPGQLERFLLPALVRRGLQARRDGAALRAGNLDPVRDFLHVADVVSAYAALAERGGVGEVYNVSSGRGRSVREVAEAVLRRLGVEAAVESDPALARPVDLPALVGDPGKLRAATGWAPARGLEDIIDDLIHATTQ